MTNNDIIEELRNITEQAANGDDITKEDIIEAIDGLIIDIGGDEIDFFVDLDDNYASYEDVDFTKLQDDF